MVCVNSIVLIASSAISETNPAVVELRRPLKLAKVWLEKEDHVKRKARKAASVDFTDEATTDAFIAHKNEILSTQRLAPGFWWENVRAHACSRGTFKVIAFGSDDRLVALETRWQADQDRLADELEAHATIGQFGVDEVEPEDLYACRGHESWSMQRCRTVCGAGLGHLFVELVDQGRQQMVSMEGLLALPAKFKTWSIKAVDLDFHGFNIALNSRDFLEEIEAHVLNKTFELLYICERRGALARDRLIVLEMKMDGKPALQDLVRKGVLVRS